MLIMLKCAPYVSDIDDRLNFLATLGFVFTGLAGLILTMDQRTLEPSFNSEMVGYFLLAFTSFVVIVHFIYVFHHILDCGRKSGSKSGVRARCQWWATVTMVARGGGGY